MAGNRDPPQTEVIEGVKAEFDAARRLISWISCRRFPAWLLDPKAPEHVASVVTEARRWVIIIKITALGWACKERQGK